MEDELEGQQQIQVFARVLVDIYGFTGESAESERRYIIASLTASEPIDYDALQSRANRHVTENQLRPALREQGLSDSEIDGVLERFYGAPDTTPES